MEKQAKKINRQLPAPAWAHRLVAILLMLGLWGLLLLSTAHASDFILVEDGRGVRVKVPKHANRVVTVSDGMIEGVMTRFGVTEKIIGIGSRAIPITMDFSYPALDGKTHEVKGGMNTVTYLNPRFRELPVVAQYGTGILYERLAGLKPDLIIVRTGSSSLYEDEGKNRARLALLESLGIPLVVLQGPNTHDAPQVSTLGREIRILGQIFQKEKTAGDLVSFLEKTLDGIEQRTRKIPPANRKSILLLGLSPRSRLAGGAGYVRGTRTLQTHLMTRFVHATNAFGSPGAWRLLNLEQLLSLDPDVIVLATSGGYHPPGELYDAPYYQSLKGMRAVRNRRVSALPFTPCNCEKRLEYPIDVMVMAQAAYPELFRDIDLASWLLDFYRQLYGVDRETARGLLSSQCMDWTLGHHKAP
ncbi:MAG: ABC transporter substrate-binding protein [Desulfobacteraceae bacterium]|nr:ABC transporter substrate-binding protein [Desulfobacteraceae bacterium]